MEPERKIEKLLRAYAKKRRVQAGDPPKLHPAARRRLQAEIARQASEPDEEDVSLTLWKLLRLRWAFLTGFALAVFFVATLFLPSLNRAKSRAQKATAMARYNLMEIGTAVRMFAEDNHERLPESLDELTNELQLDLINTILIDPRTGRRFVYVGGGQRLDRLQSNALLAYSPTDKKGHAVLFADGRVEVVEAARFSELTNRGPSQLAVVNDAARRQAGGSTAETAAIGGNAAFAPPVLAELKSDASGNKSKPADLGIATSGTGELAATAPAAPAPGFDRPVETHDFALPNPFKNIAAPASATPVLANFQVQQMGNTIRVVDADGSMYDGSLLLANETGQNEPAAGPPPVERAKTVAGRDEPQKARSNFFRVAGMNRTLKQNVVFAGNLLTLSNAATNVQSSPGDLGGPAGGGGGGGSPSPSVTANQLSWSVARITGTAAIGPTNTIEVNAIPLSP